jgi:DNA-directed RNA polymerase subunit RPC12/RpoP
MPTATFECGHCGRWIKVDSVYLGRPVRCPHCQGVVSARIQPATETAAPAPPESEIELALPLPDMPESVVTDSTPLESFSIAIDPPASLAGEIESPSAPVPADVSEQPVVEPSPDVVQPLLSAADDPLLAAAEESPVAALLSAPSLETHYAEQPPGEPAWPSEMAPRAAFPDEPETAATLPRRDRRPAPPRSGVSIWFVIPLVSYSILATVLLVMLWNRPNDIHPLIAFLPDSEGDAPGVIRKPKGVNETRKRRLISEPLPDQLKVKLGETMVVGALAVTPLRVTREQVWLSEGLTEKPEKSDGPSLVLRLRLENISADESFQPLDRYFDRKWREDRSPGAPPLTLLDAGPDLRFFGGPAEWRPKRMLDRNNSAAPEFIYLMGGDKPFLDPIDRALNPGEAVEAFVCTDGNDPRATKLVHRRGAFLWRVHVRRGLVRVQARDVPAAAVVGVTFTDRQIEG